MADQLHSSANPEARTFLVTGVSRQIGIGWAIAERLMADGHRVATAGWRPYDDRMPWGADAKAEADGPPIDHAVDLQDAEAAAGLVSQVVDTVGPVHGLALCHCESVDSDIRTTSVEAFDRHMAVNARATWQLIQSFVAQIGGADRVRRVVSVTSDHTAGNLPYGASKGAMDRIVLAAAIELADRNVTANVINPGATDTGWMSTAIKQAVRDGNLQPRLGLPGDVANLVSFLCSTQGQWINGQLLHSDGGLR